MKNNPNKKYPNRKSIRLKGYDYSQAGLYFITICCQDRKHLFGKIVDGKMILNDAGKMIDKWWQKIPDKFPDIELGTYQIMPNHFHAIIINNGANVGVDPRVNPNVERNNKNIGSGNQNTDSDNGNIGSVNENFVSNNENFVSNNGQTRGSTELSAVLQWFKTMTTNEYIRGVKNLGWERFNRKLWQRNYWDNIIRNDDSHDKISNYIINNPKKWESDKFHNTKIKN